MELPIIEKEDSESIVGCVFPNKAGDLGTVAPDEEVWSAYIRVQRYESISTELASTNIPTNTQIFIETSTFPSEPADGEWFVDDSYVWDSACPFFKYTNKISEARYFRVRIVAGSDGSLTDLRWVIGGKHL